MSSSPAAEPSRRGDRLVRIYVWIVAVGLAGGFALSERVPSGHRLFGTVPFEFIPFGLTLLGVALLHKRALEIAAAGVAVVLAYKLAFVPSFHAGHHLQHEARTLGNLFGLLLGFAILADHFERSHLPKRIPALLPGGAAGAFALLAMVWVLSAFLDNIAAAIIGGVAAKVAFQGRVTVAYVAAIVAAANAGGAGSVIGDTTTTMMWIEDVPATRVLPAFLPAFVALLVGGTFAARSQVRHQPIVRDPAAGGVRIDAIRLLIVGLVLGGTVAANVLLDFPAVGLWAALLLAAPLRKTGWRELPGALRGACFLLSLVLSASMMPVETLPDPSARTTFGLGVVSSIFDNIPLTKLAIEKNGFDWALLAYAVGYGGSLTWFGSSAGVAITKEFPQARDLGRYLKDGWPVALAYVAGFAAYLLVFAWKPWMIPE